MKGVFETFEKAWVGSLPMKMCKCSKDTIIQRFLSYPGGEDQNTLSIFLSSCVKKVQEKSMLDD